MSYAYSLQTKDSNYNTYIKDTQLDNLPVSIETVTRHLKLPEAPVSPSEEYNYLVLLIQACKLAAEKYMARTIITVEWLTYRQCFTDIIELRRSELLTLTSFKYLKDTVLTDVDSDSYNIKISNEYSQIHLKSDKSYPTDELDENPQAIEIKFTTGFGDTEADVPDDLQLALLNHIAYVYENSGDCDTSQMLIQKAKAIPSTSRLVYDQYKIHSLY